MDGSARRYPALGPGILLRFHFPSLESIAFHLARPFARGKTIPEILVPLFPRLPEEITAPALPFPTGESGRLRIGDFVYLLGRLEGTDLHVRSGIVSALSPTARVAELPIAQNVFMISAPLSAGDSGSPVLAVRDGSYELVGIAQGKYATAREAGWVLRIEPILATIRNSLSARSVSASR